ncbi:molecular chaperone [Sutterella sp.]|uniref:TorD/DmsD family molecular chaperone n=1 Tax=Sutterella sp. TaxID=1981025 RepID=UPI0026DEFEB6|nr:molecular chaperone TorD family protein [Sutterella sp.]MDO5530596.1 molecular chaperone TorD family protein [Sutterella sp.]
MTTPSVTALQPAFDALALLFLQPETLGAASALPAAAETIAEEAARCGAPDEVLFTKVDEIAAHAPPADLELAQAYAKLFLGVGEKTIPLTESVYTSADRLNCQAAQIECRRIYEDAGLELSAGPVVPEDHLGLMLGFLAVLGLRGEEDTARDFLGKHAAPMMQAVAAAINEKGPEAGPYRDAATLLEAAAALFAQKN